MVHQLWHSAAAPSYLEMTVSSPSWCAWIMLVFTYHQLLKIHPWGPPQRRGWVYCQELLSWKYAADLTPVSLALLCMHALILQCLFFHVLACATTASNVCFHLLVPPLAQCCFFFSASCLHNRMYCGINRWAYFRERKAPFTTTSFKKLGGGGLFSTVDLLPQEVEVYFISLRCRKPGS